MGKLAKYGLNERNQNKTHIVELPVKQTFLLAQLLLPRPNLLFRRGTVYPSTD